MKLILELKSEFVEILNNLFNIDYEKFEVVKLNVFGDTLQDEGKVVFTTDGKTKLGFSISNDGHNITGFLIVGADDVYMCSYAGNAAITKKMIKISNITLPKYKIYKIVYDNDDLFDCTSFSVFKRLENSIKI